MEDLQLLHLKFTAASTAFRNAAIAQGFSCIKVSDRRVWWLSEDTYPIVAAMLENNQDPEGYCLDLTFEGKAFFEYLAIPAKSLQG